MCDPRSAEPLVAIALSFDAINGEYNRRTNMVKDAMDARAGATREELIDAIVTEKGVILNPTVANMQAAFG